MLKLADYPVERQAIYQQWGIDPARFVRSAPTNIVIYNNRNLATFTPPPVRATIADRVLLHLHMNAIKLQQIVSEHGRISLRALARGTSPLLPLELRESIRALAVDMTAQNIATILEKSLDKLTASDLSMLARHSKFGPKRVLEVFYLRKIYVRRGFTRLPTPTHLQGQTLSAEIERKGLEIEAAITQRCETSAISVFAKLDQTARRAIINHTVRFYLERQSQLRQILHRKGLTLTTLAEHDLLPPVLARGVGRAIAEHNPPAVERAGLKCDINNLLGLHYDGFVSWPGLTDRGAFRILVIDALDRLTERFHKSILPPSLHKAQPEPGPRELQRWMRRRHRLATAALSA